MAPNVTPIVVDRIETTSAIKIERCAPLSVRANMSLPRESVPKGWVQDGPFDKLAVSRSMKSKRQMNLPKIDARKMTVRTTRLTIANLCRTKRRNTVRHCERTSTANSASCEPMIASMSAHPDPWVEHGVNDVGDDVEDDRRGCCDHDEGEQSVRIG